LPKTFRFENEVVSHTRWDRGKEIFRTTEGKGVKTVAPPLQNWSGNREAGCTEGRGRKEADRRSEG